MIFSPGTFTALFRRQEHGSGFIATIAELPGPYAEGASLVEAREALRRQLTSFFAMNRALAFESATDNALTESISIGPVALHDAETAGETTVIERVDIPIPICIHIDGSSTGHFFQQVIDSSVIVAITFDARKLRELVRSVMNDAAAK